MKRRSRHSYGIGCLYLLLLLPLMFVSCTEEDNGTLPPSPVIVIEQIPEGLPAGYALFFPIMVQVEHADIWEIDSVACQMSNPQGQHYATFYLFDDGSVYDHPTEADFLSVRSGDNVPGDGHFSRQISGQGFIDYGTYVLTFNLSGAQSVSDSIDIAPVETPFFTEITPVVDSLPSGFAPFEYQAHIQKPTAIDRIDSVCLEISYSERPETILRRIAFNVSSGDTIWTLTLTPGHFWGIRTGLYDFDFVLWDRFGLSADTSHDFIGIWNGVPTVFNSTLPDTIWRPRLGEPNDTTAISVQVNDSESLMDIAEVRFEVRKVWQDWQPHPDFYLLDQGGPWDAVAGDGIYSVPLVTSPSDSLKDNLYYFRFYARDKTAQQSDYLIDSIRVIERPIFVAVVGLQTRNGRSPGKTGVGVVL
ncbi:MAG: hypothetical protein V1784_06665 [bacterium]